MSSAIRTGNLDLDLFLLHDTQEADLDRRIEQRDELGEDPRLRLTAQSEKDEILLPEAG